MVRTAPAADLTTTLELLALADLRPHPRNDGTHPPDEIAHLKTSITTHGIYRNVVVAQDGTILAGHGVIEAARQVGRTHIAGQRMSYGPDDPRALQLLVGDNHIARLRVQDDAQLVALLQDLQAHDPLALLGTGFDAEALAALAEAQGMGNGAGAPGAEVVEPDEPWDRLGKVLERWQVQEGDLWALGRHRLVHGDCREDETLSRLLDGAMPTMVFADPPYGVSIVTPHESVGGGEEYGYPFGGVTNGMRTDLAGTHASKPFGRKADYGRVGTHASNVVAVGKYAPVIGDESPETAITAATTLLQAYPKAVHIWWGAQHYADHLPPFSCWLVWNKETSGDQADCELAWTNQPKAVRMFTHRWNGMLRASEHERRWHPTQKPAALAAWVYETLGTARDVILDPFLGSGPSLLAAEQTNRTVYGCELSLEYVAITLERWHQLTGDMPQRLV